MVQLELDLGNYVAIYPTLTTREPGLQHILGVGFPTGMCLCSVGCAQAAMKTSNGCIGLRINEVELAQSFTVHFIEVQAVQTFAANRSIPECCQLSVSYPSGIQGSLLT